MEHAKADDGWTSRSRAELIGILREMGLLDDVHKAQLDTSQNEVRPTSPKPNSTIEKT